MTNLMRVNVTLAGWEGAPGINTLYFSQGSLSNVDSAMAQIIGDELHTGFTSCRGAWRPSLEATIEPECPIIDVASGNIIDVAIMDDPPEVIASNATAGQMSTAVCAVVNFKSSEYRNGRLVRGRMFWGPLSGSQLLSTGMIDPSGAAAIEGAFTAVSSGLGPRLAIYSRPGVSNDGVGAWADVTNVSVARKPGILTSRRD